jgi:Transcriptional regulatory protein, C terminal
LLERPGELISKEELMGRVWPGTCVDPATLTVHIAALRRALRDGNDGKRFLMTISGRGYRFVTPVSVLREFESPPADEAEQIQPHRVIEWVLFRNKYAYRCCCCYRWGHVGNALRVVHMSPATRLTPAPWMTRFGLLARGQRHWPQWSRSLEAR